MNHVDNPFESPVVLSTCTGMRGLEIGVERVLGELRVATYVEIETFVIENLVQQMEQGVLDPAPIWANLKTFPWEAFYGKLHWILGGYPCQPFSHAGLRQGADDIRHLWPAYRRGIKKSRPMGVFFENVEGHISLGLRDVLTDLRKLGYQVEVGLFSAAEVGAPHRRNRVFILGLENSFLIRMRGWSDEQRENWRRKIQTPRSGELADTGYGGYRHGAICEHPADESQERPEKFSSGSELGNAGCVIGRSESERGMDLERDSLDQGRRIQSSDIAETSDRALGDTEHPGSQGQIPVRESGIPTKSGLLELSGLADADDNGKQQFEGIFGEIRERAGHGSEAVGNAAGDDQQRDGETSEGRQKPSGGSGVANSIGQGLAQREKQSARKECAATERSGNEGGIMANPNICGEQQRIDQRVGRFEEQNAWPSRPGEDQYSWEATRLESSVGYAVNGYNYREDLLRMAGNAVVPQQSEKAFRTLLLKFIK